MRSRTVGEYDPTRGIVYIVGVDVVCIVGGDVVRIVGGGVVCIVGGDLVCIVGYDRVCIVGGDSPCSFHREINDDLVIDLADTFFELVNRSPIMYDSEDFGCFGFLTDGVVVFGRTL